MKSTRRKLLAILALLAGGALAYFELRVANPSGERWFWLFVALLLIVLGLVELVSKNQQAGGEGSDER